MSNTEEKTSENDGKLEKVIVEEEDDKLLKLSLLSSIYNSPDLVHYCLSSFDKKNSSSLASQWMEQLNNVKI